MKAHKLFIVIAFTALLFSSCDNPSKGEFWGETKFFSNFPGREYKSVIMEQTLEFDFNDDAQRLIDNIEFEVVKKNEQDKFVPVREEKIVLYKNGKKCANNILKVKSSEKEVTLGIEFTKEAEKGYHTLYLREKGTSGLDRIDYLELTGGFCVVKYDVWNPLALIMFWGLVAIIAFLLVWHILSRTVNPNIRFSKIYFDYNDGQGEQERRGIGKCYKIVCTNKKQRVSPFYKFFVGNIAFEVNEFWAHPVTIKSGTRNNVRITGLGEFELNSDETVRREPFTITNDHEQKVTITTS